MGREIIRTKDFATDAVNFIVDLARKSLAERNEFRIALSGGNTPRPVYAEIARICHDFPWDRTLITFGDERCVPPDDAQSNFRMARETLFAPANVPEKSIMRTDSTISNIAPPIAPAFIRRLPPTEPGMPSIHSSPPRPAALPA